MRKYEIVKLSVMVAVCSLLLSSCAVVRPLKTRHHNNYTRKNLTDVEFLRGKDFEALGLGENWGLTNISGLQGMHIQFLDLSKTSVTDLSPLTGMPLKELWLANTPVKDLSPLKGMNLDKLHLDACLKLESLESLRGAQVKRLYLAGNWISDLGPLEGMQVEHLSIRNTSVRDLSPLKAMPLLSLDISGTKVSDLSPLKDKHIAHLTCLGVAVTNAQTILATLPLTYLAFDGKSIRSWAFIYDKDIHLDLRGGPTPDLASLRKATCLKLSGMGITNIAPLVGVKLTRTPIVGGYVLDMSHNAITDISPLKSLVEHGLDRPERDACYIDLTGNPISDYSPLEHLPDNIEIWLDKTQLDACRAQGIFLDLGNE